MSNTISNKFDSSKAVLFGSLSPWVNPEDAYCDNWLTDQLLTGGGVNLNCTGAQAMAVCARLKQAGIKHARIDCDWGSIDYTSGLFDPSVGQKIAACAVAGIRPLLLLNANDGRPTPTKTLVIQLSTAGNPGDPAVAVASVTDALGNPIDPATLPLGLWGLSNITGTGTAAECLVTAYAGGVATLSQPLASALPAATNLPGAVITQQPFHAVGTAAFNATLSAWLVYAQQVVALAATYITATATDVGFDLEVWNEIGFASKFLAITNYYNPAPVDGLYVQADVLYALLAATVAAFAAVPGLGVTSGFADQSPFPSANGPLGAINPNTGLPYGSNVAAPVNLRALSNHPYKSLQTFDGTGAGVEGGNWLTALNQVEFPVLFYPAFNAYFPEYTLTALQTENQRNISPVATFISGVPHQRGLMAAGSSYPVESWITEVNLDPTPLLTLVAGLAALPVSSQMAVVEHFKAKVALRYLCAMLGKGFSRVYLFAVSDQAEPFGLGLFPNVALFANSYPVGAAPAIDAIGRLMGSVPPSALVNAPMPLTLVSLSETHGHIQVPGDPATAALANNPHPPLYNRDCVFWQPFQASDTLYCVVVYVQTRDLSTLTGPIANGPQAMDLPDETYTFTVSGFPAALANPVVTLYDPLSDTTEAGTVVSYLGGVIVVTANLTDSPRVMTIRPAVPQEGAGNLPYDPTTPLGQTRLFAADTSVFLDPATGLLVDNTTFSDAELNYFLLISPMNLPMVAASFALEALAADAARLAYVIKVGSLIRDKTKLAQSLADRAQKLRELAPFGGVVDAPDEIFSLDNTNDDIIGTMTGW